MPKIERHKANNFLNLDLTDEPKHIDRKSMHKTINPKKSQFKRNHQKTMKTNKTKIFHYPYVYTTITVNRDSPLQTHPKAC